MLTNNADIRASLPATTYGYGSATKSQNNWLGVGIDYRSIYGTIYRALYGLNPATFFPSPVSLERDISLDPARIGRVETSYQPLSAGRVRVRVSAEVSGANLSLDKAGYVRFGTATDSGTISLQSAYNTRRWYMSGSTISFTRDVNVGQAASYRIEAHTNQYVDTVFSGAAIAPRIVATAANAGPLIDTSADSILYAYRNTAVNGDMPLSGSGVVLWNSGTGTSGNIFVGDNGVSWNTSSGLTAVTSVFGTGLTWQGGFTLGRGYSGTDFFGTGSLVAGDVSILGSAVARVAKIGSDTPGVGMRLSQPVRVSLDGATANASYRVYRSEDGITWENITPADRITADMSGKVSFSTDRFSYFAIVSVTPVCTISFDTGSVPVGESATLSYTVTNASTAQIAPYVGAVTPLASSGTVSVTVPSGTTEYVMTLEGNTAYSCSASITGTGGSGSSGSPESSGSSGSSDVSPSLLG